MNNQIIKSVILTASLLLFLFPGQVGIFAADKQSPQKTTANSPQKAKPKQPREIKDQSDKGIEKFHSDKSEEKREKFKPEVVKPIKTSENDLVIYMRDCPHETQPGKELGTDFLVTAMNTKDRPLTNIVVEIVLLSELSYPAPAPHAQASSNYTSGMLLQGGRLEVSFEDNGTKRVQLKGPHTIPEDTPPGVYFLAAVIDAGNQIQEANENNNVTFCRLVVKGEED